MVGAQTPGSIPSLLLLFKVLTPGHFLLVPGGTPNPLYLPLCGSGFVYGPLEFLLFLELGLVVVVAFGKGYFLVVGVTLVYHLLFLILTPHNALTDLTLHPI